jgi:hypothetical protein
MKIIKSNKLREKAVAAGLQNVEEQHFKRTGKRMSANDIMREALGIPFNAPSAHVENNSFERVKIIIGDSKCKIGFDVKKREKWDNAAIIEVFEEFIAMMKAPSEKIETDDEI